MRAQGFTVLVGPTSFQATDVRGPPDDSESERPRRWGLDLARRVEDLQRWDAS